ncbi:hypothetical protein CALVIDRAFT_179032 [Calocera viscosa TUFC12733]|uniref:Uncharacterized protein n=1 Tax=Calocera viscosa (strain TUFC12733) TaxID=1330018 RepID=A0A167KYE8_CALVF|nr:hypothetical protein CALVIDRAFT_179032 [Calocera viscosa TUFC12733]
MSVLLPCAAHPPSPHTRRQGAAHAYGTALSPSHSYSHLAALLSLAHTMQSMAAPSSYPSRPRERERGQHTRSPSSSRLRLPSSLPAPRVPPTLVNSPHLRPSSGSAFRQHHSLAELGKAREEAERDAWGIGDQVPMRSNSFSFPAEGLRSREDAQGRPDLPQRAKSDSHAPPYTPPPRTHPTQPSRAQQHPPASSASSSTPYPIPIAQAPGHARTGSTVYSHSRLGPDSPAAVGAEEEMREYFRRVEESSSGTGGWGCGQGAGEFIWVLRRCNYSFTPDSQA